MSKTVTGRMICISIALLLMFIAFNAAFTNESYAKGKYHLSNKNITIYLGEEGFLELLTSSDHYAKGKTKWTISDKSLIRGEASLKGKHYDFTPKKTGTCTITCTNNGKKYKCKVKIKSMKKKVKVIARVTDEKGNETQLLRVKNCTKKKRAIYFGDGEGYGYSYMSIPAGKYAYYAVDSKEKIYTSVYPVGRVNSFIMEMIEPKTNYTSKAKVSITLKEDNKYVIKYTNKSSEYITVDVDYVFYNKEGKAIAIDGREVELKPHKKKTSKTYTCKTDEEIASYKAYVYAVGF